MLLTCSCLCQENSLTSIYFTFVCNLITIRACGCFHIQQLWKNHVRSHHHDDAETVSTQYFQKALEWLIPFTTGIPLQM